MKLEEYAKKTFLALKNPFGTVVSVDPLVIDKASYSFEINDCAYYVGVKNTNVIPQSLLTRLEEKGFLMHTRDVMAYGGRAIDIYHRNPITDRFMTGSSSGTALNVFYGINDLGIGTDGGGSVLAPAAALNLIGFISPTMEEEQLKKFSKKSTDGIEFYPSVGYITRDFEVLKRAVEASISLEETTKEYTILLNSDQSNKIEQQFLEVVKKQLATTKIEEQEYPNRSTGREELISYLNKLKENQILISVEGPVDTVGIGDTVFGHFDAETKKSQEASGKGFIRVANMCNKSAMTIPLKELGMCAVFICDSNPKAIAMMLKITEQVQIEQSELIKRYFSNLNMYF